MPYRGSSLAYPDVLGGRVDLFFDSTPAALPYVKSGQAKGIAILTAKRHPDMPNVPTMTESACRISKSNSWIGIFAPAKTPTTVIARLQKEIAAASAEMKPRLASMGGELMEVPPEKLNAVIKADTDKWLKIIKDAGISLRLRQPSNLQLEADFLGEQLFGGEFALVTPCSGRRRGKAPASCGCSRCRRATGSSAGNIIRLVSSAWS